MLVEAQCDLEIDTHNYGIWAVEQTFPHDMILFETLKKMKLKARAGD